jgi:RecB family exonuclease
VELQRGLELGGFTLSGKIDRIDLDPFSARGIVQDYKSGRVAHSAAKIESELRLQIPLYVLALRDLVGIEPLGGLYRALAGPREARGLLRADARDAVPNLKRSDYVDEDAFWGHVDRAKERAGAAVERIRAGDVRHDPRGGECPAWCDLWPMCRIKRS